MSDPLDRITLALAETILDEGLVERSPRAKALEKELQDAGPDGVPFWRALLENEAADCRLMAIFNLRRLAAGAAEADDREEREAGMHREVVPLDDDTVGALARHALEDPEPSLRREAAAAVVTARAEGALPLLEALLADPAEDVEAYAEHERERLGASGAGAARALADLLDYDVQEHVAHLLMAGPTGEVAPEGFVPATERNLAQRRAAVAFAERVAGEPDAAQLLEPAALARFASVDPDEEVRRVAAAALERILPPAPSPGISLVRYLCDRGWVTATDVAILRLVKPLSAARAADAAAPHVRNVVRRITGAERLPEASPSDGPPPRG